MNRAVVGLAVLDCRHPDRGVGRRSSMYRPRPVLMCVCVASTAAFLTPGAAPANMMVMGPAGYRFGDYRRLGLPMVAVFFLVAVGLVPLVWPL